MTTLARFMTHVERDDATGCWLWTGAIARNGYGQVGQRPTSRLPGCESLPGTRRHKGAHTTQGRQEDHGRNESHDDRELGTRRADSPGDPEHPAADPDEQAPTTPRSAPDGHSPRGRRASHRGVVTMVRRVGTSRIMYAEPEGDGYTSQPTHVRVYREDRPDYPWQVDGADDAGNYTEDVRSFETFGEAIEAVPEFIARAMGAWKVRWIEGYQDPMPVATAAAQRRAELAGISWEQASEELDDLLHSIHVEAGTLPEALHRARFCRPADSREVAAQLLREVTA